MCFQEWKASPLVDATCTWRIIFRTVPLSTILSNWRLHLHWLSVGQFRRNQMILAHCKLRLNVYQAGCYCFGHDQTLLNKFCWSYPGGLGSHSTKQVKRCKGESLKNVSAQPNCQTDKICLSLFVCIFCTFPCSCVKPSWDTSATLCSYVLGASQHRQVHKPYESRPAVIGEIAI